MAKRNAQRGQESRGLNKLELTDARCRVKQAQAVLGAWLEVATGTDSDVSLIGAVTSLLELVPEAMQEAESELADYVMRDHMEASHDK